MDTLMNNPSLGKLFDRIEKDDEIEISFLPKVSKLTLEKYITLIKFFSNAGKPLETQDTLNVSYSYNFDTLNNYRITIDGLDNINKVISDVHTRENHIIFSLLKEQCDTKDYITAMDKHKTKENIIDIEELGIRVRKSKELPLPENLTLNLTHTDRKYINFRYIQRASLIIEETKDYILRIDLSYVKSSDNLDVLERKTPIIELEIDLSIKKSVTKEIKTKLKSLLSTTYINVQKVLQKSNIVVSKDEQQDTITNMFNLLFPDKSVSTRDLPAMQLQSAEVQHIVDYINHDYCVTDKADGDRHFLFIMDGKIMLISNTLEVKQIQSVKNTEQYNNTILDGEYIFNTEHQTFMFLAFDCLMFKGEDKRQESILINRLSCVRDITKNLFGQKYGFTKYEGVFDFDKMSKYYINDVKKHMDELNASLKKSSVDVVSMKYFFFPQGIHKCEIFFLSNLMWQLYTSGKDFNCPYTLDGGILTPIDQIYTRSNKDILRKIFKLKPSKFNSLDLYITLERDPVTHQVIDIYDDAEANSELLDLSNKEFIDEIERADGDKVIAKGMMYRIVNLHVGKIIGNTEHPVLFHEHEEQHYANLYIEDGEIRDIEGNIIQDKTVVEFIYNNDPQIKPGFRWIPLRTRYDKTESVNMFKRKYGNNNEIAEKTWRSMINGIEMSDIELLGSPLTYEAQHSKLRSMITTSMIERDRRENAYYNLINDLAQPLKHWHNWLKSNLIFTYAGKKNVDGDKYVGLDLLDYGCGRGGDIGKFFGARLKSYVGFDSDHGGIHSGTDGALSRYQTYKKKMGVIAFKMNFLVADGGVLLNQADQERALGEVSSNNTRDMLAFFDNPNPKQYDIITCHFVIHYFFKNDNTLDNFLANVKKFTKPSGYITITTFDDKVTNESLKKGNVTSYYTTKEGEKKVIFDVKKKYEGESDDKTGQPIDVHLPAFDDDKYVVEYMVPKNLLVRKMKESGFRLIDTDLFQNTYNKHKSFFEDVVQEEEHQGTRKFYMQVKEYYNTSDPMNQACFQFTNLSRYYVFQKEDNLDIHKAFSSSNASYEYKKRDVKKKVAKKR